MEPVFILSILLALTGVSTLFNFLFLKWTRELGIKMLAADGARWSTSYKPAIGGISFYMVFLMSYLIYLFQTNPDLRLHEELAHLGILLAVTLGFFTGLADDTYNTVPWLKLAAQVVCGIMLVTFGIRIEFFQIFWMDAVLTVFWTVAVMNSLNMLDNMDGITSVVSIFILLASMTTAIAMPGTALFYVFICGGVISALIGFLMFNWNPSKIFMGDTGSQMLGALLAAVGVIFFWNNTHVTTEHTWWSKLAVVITAFVVPIGDSLTVTINRILRGQSPFVGGRDHTTHHLSYAGLTDRQVAYVMLTLSAISFIFISALRYISEMLLNTYLFILFAFALGVIGFLYSTTVWKKSRSAFRAKHMQSAST